MLQLLKLKDMPVQDRPREKLIKSGVKALTDSELLAILLGTGTNEVSATVLGQRILMKFNSLNDIYCQPLGELRKVKGLGYAKICRILAGMELGLRFSSEKISKGAVFKDSIQVYNHFHSYFKGMKKEEFHLVSLNSKNCLINDYKIAEGNIIACGILPGDIFKPLIVESAVAAILIHNHPSSGDPTPSEEDLFTTRKLSGAAELLGIKILDHIIIGDNGYYSMADHRQL